MLYRVIIQFKCVTSGAKEEKKAVWKDIEQELRKSFPKLKVVYGRGDASEGELAVSSHKLKKEVLEKVSKAKVSTGGREYQITKLEGE